MHILDRDGDGEIEYDEFCNKLGNITIYDVAENESPRSWVPPADDSSDDEDGGREEYADSDDDPDKETEPPLETTPARQHAVPEGKFNTTTGSSDAYSPTQGQRNRRATVHKGEFEDVQVAKSMSTGDIDFRCRPPPRSPTPRAVTPSVHVGSGDSSC